MKHITADTQDVLMKYQIIVEICIATNTIDIEKKTGGYYGCNNHNHSYCFSGEICVKSAL